MKVAFSIWQDRVATVFDCSDLFFIAGIDDGQIIEETRISIKAGVPLQRAAELVEIGVQTLVCGAVSREAWSLVTGRGIEVIPFVAGPLPDVLAAFVAGSLENGDFLMPGCYRHGRHGFRTSSELAAVRRMGRGPGFRQAGPVGYCVCTGCDYRTPHERGVPCRTRICPMCGLRMGREEI